MGELSRNSLNKERNEKVLCEELLISEGVLETSFLTAVSSVYSVFYGRDTF